MKKKLSASVSTTSGRCLKPNSLSCGFATGCSLIFTYIIVFNGTNETTLNTAINFVKNSNGGHFILRLNCVNACRDGGVSITNS